MRYRIEMSRTARDVIVHLPPELKQRVRDALRFIAQNPFKGKTLKDELAGLYSYRIGTSRIIYRIEGRKVEIIVLGSRIDIYERAALEVAGKSRKKDTPH